MYVIFLMPAWNILLYHCQFLEVILYKDSSKLNNNNF